MRTFDIDLSVKCSYENFDNMAERIELALDHDCTCVFQNSQLDVYAHIESESLDVAMKYLIEFADKLGLEIVGLSFPQQSEAAKSEVDSSKRQNENQSDHNSFRHESTMYTTEIVS